MVAVRSPTGISPGLDFFKEAPWEEEHHGGHGPRLVFVAVPVASESKITIESLSDTEETDPFGAVVRTYRAYRLDMEGRTYGPPLLFEARDDAAALLRARASMSDKNIEVWEGMRRVTAWKLP